MARERVRLTAFTEQQADDRSQKKGNIYDIYEQNIPEIDMSTHLPRWKALLEAQIGRELEADDFLFPYIAPNGVIHIKRGMSYSTLQVLLTKFSQSAGVEKHYTTHCFRRGGAQYQFMFAPIGKRWSLSRIRWWGGWAVGEHVRATKALATLNFCNNIQQVDTFIKYLVDSLQSYESGHGDALHPIPLDPEKTFMGDHVALMPVTNHEFYRFRHSLDEKLDAIMSTVVSATASNTGSGAGPERTQTLINKSQTRIKHSPYGRPASVSISALVSIPTSTIANPVEDSGYTLPAPINGPATTTATAQHTLKLPISGVLVPDLGHSSGAWKRAIKQWEEYDPTTKCALKDWPKDWYTGVMRTVTGSKRSQRQIVFEEYERYVQFIFWST